MGEAGTPVAPADRVRGLMPQLRADLARLVAIPSVSATGYPPETHASSCSRRTRTPSSSSSRAPASRTIGRSSCRTPRRSSLGEIPGAARARRRCCSTGTTTSFPAGDEAKWESPPFEADRARRRDLRTRLRRHEVEHPHAHRRATGLGGSRPVGIKIVIEGQEEVGQRAQRPIPPTQPELFAADAMIIGDMGSVRPGVPTLTIGLRGMAGVDRRRRDARRPEALGQFGGAAPDALARADPRARDAPRRQRRRRRRGAPPRGVDGAATARRSSATLAEVRAGCRSSARAVSASASGRARRSRSPGSTRFRRRRAQRRRRRRPREDQRARPPGAGPARGAGGADPAPRGAAAVRDRARPSSGRDRQRLPRGDDRPRLRGGARGAGGRLGQRGVSCRDRRLDPARQRPPVAVAGGRDPAPRHDRRLREHPCAERARALDEFEKAVLVEAEFFGRFAEAFSDGRARST